MIFYMLSDKNGNLILVGSPQIRIPERMFFMAKNGQVREAPTTTKTGALSMRGGVRSINLIPDGDKVEVFKLGETLEEFRKRQSKKEKEDFIKKVNETKINKKIDMGEMPELPEPRKEKKVRSPEEEFIYYKKKVEKMEPEERSKLLSELRKANDRMGDIRKLKSKKAELEREELYKITLNPLHNAVKTFIENESIRKGEEARDERMRLKAEKNREKAKPEPEPKIEKVKEPEETEDTISANLQKLIYTSSIDKIKKSLNDLKYKGRMNTNKVLLNMQLLQNLDTKKQKELIKLLE